MMFGTVASKRLLKSYINIKMVLLHVIKRNFLRFVVGYDFCPTSCVFSIPSLRDIKHTTHWRKIISNHKPWDILYIYTSTDGINIFLKEALFVVKYTTISVGEAISGLSHPFLGQGPGAF